MRISVRLTPTARFFGGPEVFDALLDITDRLVPTAQLGGPRADIRTPLARLEKALRHADASAGRMALAAPYEARSLI